ncbi:MAG: transglutaminase family protein [Cyanobium sp. Prado107]|jgi:transglutaminase-like putative cysteine protease|nr:transglutaminase family protein [Cyanobium sp. Prado107]
MLFHVRHALRYAYERPVFLEPTTLRLTPRNDPAQRLLHHDLRVTPQPSGSSRVLEADGAEAVVLWFQDVQEQLTIEVDMVVRTLRENPFDWIITHPAALHLPAAYPPDEALSLTPCLEGVAPIANPVRQWAAELAAAVDGSASAFLMHLADTIHHDFHHIGRPDGEPMGAAETLRSRSGACRDTAMLYVQACRSLGLAARFVSGYSMHHPEEVSEHELHAWAEVYLPGGGWRAYDPSLGLAVADGHVALAAAPDHHLAAPVSGRYRGTGVGSSMRYAVEVRTAESLEALQALDRDRPLQMPAPEEWLSGETAAGSGIQAGRVGT